MSRRVAVRCKSPSCGWRGRRLPQVTIDAGGLYGPRSVSATDWGCPHCQGPVERTWGRRRPAVAAALVAVLLAGGCSTHPPAVNLERQIDLPARHDGSVLVRRQRLEAAPSRPRRTIVAARIADALVAQWTRKRNTHEREREVRHERKRKRERRLHR